MHGAVDSFVVIGFTYADFSVGRAVFLRFILFFDKIVALSLLPILFIVFGIDQWSKIMLIVIGVGPTMMLDIHNIVKAVPQEQMVKAFTLKSNNLDVAYRVILKQVLPQVINSLRLNLKPMIVSVCGRDDCVDRWAGLPDRDHAAAHGDGIIFRTCCGLRVAVSD